MEHILAMKERGLDWTDECRLPTPPGPRLLAEKLSKTFITAGCRYATIQGPAV